MADHFVARGECNNGSRLRVFAAALLAATLGTLGSTPAIGQSDKTDIVLFKNGDRLTGEVKGLDRGKISFDTSATGVINLEWDDIDQIYSTMAFELVLETGEELYGTLAAAENPGEIRLQTPTVTRDLPILTVVRMTPIQSTFIERIEMNVDAGYSLAKANDLEQTNLGYDFKYRDQIRQLTLNFDTSVSSSESDPSSTRVFTNFAYRRFLTQGNWDPFGLGQIERNDELGIDRRQTLGGGMSRWLRDTNTNRIAFGGGLVFSSEDDAASTETKTDTEALISMELEWFRYDEPELDVSTQFNLYKRLSGSKEPRGNLDVSLRWELFKDFFWGFSVYYTFDQQSETDEPTTDYGSFTSLGWKF
jgi:hypothetical protein